MPFGERAEFEGLTLRRNGPHGCGDLRRDVGLQLLRHAAGRHDFAKLVQHVHSAEIEDAVRGHHKRADTVDGFSDAGFVGGIGLQTGAPEIELARMVLPLVQS